MPKNHMKRYTARVWGGALTLLMVAGMAWARDPVAASITIVDGGAATVIHGVSKLSSQEGATVSAEDIIETSPATNLLRLEFDGGVLLDLGPSSRVMIKPVTGVGGLPVAYLLEGWAKLSVDKSQTNKVVLASPVLDVTGVERDLVLRIKGGEGELFAESGAVQLAVQGKDGKPSPAKVDRGTYLARHKDGGMDTAARPAQAFIQAVPRAFMDTLPSRAALFKGKDIALNPAGRLSYDDTQAWLNAEPRIRIRYVSRWKPLLQDEAFRKALIAQMPLHPEWHPILFPPKPRANEALKP